MYPEDKYETVVKFYRKEIPDAEGRLIDEIRSWNNERLEYIHDYIQWLFPLRKKGSTNFNAPVLDNNQISVFHNDKKLQNEITESLKVMLKFYGLEYNCQEGYINITKSDSWNERKKVWLTYGNHNFLRITRILTSLRILGLSVQSKAFFEALSRIYESEGYEIIGTQTFEIWKSASGLQ